jgi:hypothetical protein
MSGLLGVGVHTWRESPPGEERTTPDRVFVVPPADVDGWNDGAIVHDLLPPPGVS